MPKSTDAEVSQGQRELAEKYAPLLAAVGIDPDEFSPLDIYLLSGRIIKDDEVFKKRLALTPPGQTVPVNPLVALNQMTGRERSLVRERIGA